MWGKGRRSWPLRPYREAGWAERADPRSAGASFHDLFAVRGPTYRQRAHLTKRGKVRPNGLLIRSFRDDVEVVLLVRHRIPVDLDPGRGRVLNEGQQSSGHFGIPRGASFGRVGVLSDVERHGTS